MSAPTPAAQRRRAARGAFATLAACVLAVVAIAVVSSPGATLPSVGPRASQSCSTATVLAANPGAVADIQREAQADFHQQLNTLRQSQGRRMLVWNQAITDPSVAWSRTMSGQIPPGGSSSDPGWLHHARDTGSGDGVTPEQDYVNINSRIVANWTRLAENVGVGGMRSSCSLDDLRTNTDRVVDALHNAFVASPGHYRNMVADHNQVGIGVHIDDDELWVTVRFANGDLPSAPPAGFVSTAAGSYIDAVFSLFVDRAASTTEAQTWGPRVDAGDRLSLTATLAASDAWAGERVNDLYLTVLGRGADAAGRSYWVDQIGRGMQLETVALAFYASPEYFSDAGGTNRSFVRSLYEDLLGRSADGAGLSYWTGQLDRGAADRVSATVGFFGSIESRTDRAAGLYREVFGTTPSAGQVQPWIERIALAGDIRTAAEMAASNTFWDRATG